MLKSMTSIGNAWTIESSYPLSQADREWLYLFNQQWCGQFLDTPDPIANHANYARRHDAENIAVSSAAEDASYELEDTLIRVIDWTRRFR